MNNNEILTINYSSIKKVYHWYCNLYLTKKPNRYPYEREDIFQSSCEAFLKYYDFTRGKVLPCFVYCVRSTVSGLKAKSLTVMRKGDEVDYEKTEHLLSCYTSSIESRIHAKQLIDSMYSYVKKKYPDNYTLLLDAKALGWTGVEVSEKLSMTEKSVKQLTYICLKDLREKYGCKDLPRCSK